jgi:hypothetical protein
MVVGLASKFVKEKAAKMWGVKTRSDRAASETMGSPRSFITSLG